ncbi:MAG: sugar phosphate isomerase/epimerase family protein [Spirochaetota bacterium]
MKLGVLTVLYGGKSWEEAVKTASRKGVQAVEVGAGGFVGKNHCNPEQLLKDESARKKFVDAYTSKDLELSAISVHGNPLHPDEKLAKQYEKDITDAIQLAEKIGVKVVNGFAGCPGAGEDAKYPNWITCPWPPYFGDAYKWQWENRVIPFWKEMSGRLSDAGVKFGFEMHPGDVVFNPEALLRLRDQAGEAICCNFDPSHLFWQGMDPLTIIKMIGDIIVHVHAKDSRVDESVVTWRGVNDPKHYSDVKNRAWTFRTVGYGHDRLFWNNFVSNLRLCGYDGVISIEHEDPLMSADEGFDKAVKLLKEVLLFEKPGEMWWA